MTDIKWNPHKDLSKPLHWRKPRRAMVGCDLFAPEMPFEFADKVFAVMALVPQCTFHVLTGYPERMAEYLESDIYSKAIVDAAHLLPDTSCVRVPFSTVANPLPNVWLGTTVTNQQDADERIPHLLRCPAAVRFLSCEPLLGAITLGRWVGECTACSGSGIVNDGFDPQDDEDCSRCEGTGFEQGVSEIDWVICGGETGKNARPMHPDWARSLRDQCQAAGVPFFFKQWGEWLPGTHFTDEIRKSDPCLTSSRFRSTSSHA